MSHNKNRLLKNLISFSLIIQSFQAFAFLPKNSTSTSNNFYASTPITPSFESNEYTSSIKTINEDSYIAGGVASILLGFGIGHAIQGRWKERGWIHTAFQTGVIAGFLFGGNFFLPESITIEHYALYFLSGTLLFMGSRVWETVDAWALPQSIKVISSNQQNNLYKTHFLYSQNRAKISGIALQWQF